MEKRLYLVNYHDGQVQASFDDADQLVAYLKRKEEAGTLMGEAAYGIFFGVCLSTHGYFESALKKAVTPS